MSGDGYDTGYKSRWQTDFGDPFNDRGSRTPFRMHRGEFRGPQERDFRGGHPGFSDPMRGAGFNYDRDYSATPMGFDPYTDQARRGYPMGRATGRWNRYDRGYRGRGARGG